MHGRIQTWYPFNIQIYLNGREWLGSMMSKTGVSFIKNDNCFTWVSDFNKAFIQLSVISLQSSQPLVKIIWFYTKPEN